MSQFSIGADPELFVFNRKTQKFVSAHEMFVGTKTEPWKALKEGAIQVDGTAAEFNIEPASSKADFRNNIHAVTEFMSQCLIGYDPDMELVAVPVADYDEEYFLQLPDHTKEMGCDPDFNAWEGGRVNPRPKGTHRFRSGGGHIHVGWTEDEEAMSQSHFSDCIIATKQLDSALFLPSLLWDDDNRRRALYGKMGAFRPKGYGVEYRPLSNAWLADPDLIDWVYDAVQYSMEVLHNEKIHLWASAEFKEAMETKNPSRKDVIAHCDRMTNLWGFPELPLEYLK